MEELKFNILKPYFYSFLFLLVKKIASTYMVSYSGENIFSTEDVKNHYKWCYTQALTQFKKNNLFIFGEDFFKESFIFFVSNFYNNKDISLLNLSSLLKTTEIESGVLSDLYSLFTKDITLI